MRILHAALCSACGLIALYAACPMTFVAMAQRVLMHAAALAQPSMKFNGVLPRSPHWLHGESLLLISNKNEDILKRIKRTYYFSKIRKYVKNNVRKCDTF